MEVVAQLEPGHPRAGTGGRGAPSRHVHLNISAHVWKYAGRLHCHIYNVNYNCKSKKLLGTLQNWIIGGIGVEVFSIFNKYSISFVQ